MRRGEVWSAAGGRDYAGKPRPVVIVQDDRFDANDSITVCPLTSDETKAPLVRLPVQPSASNGLRAASHLMVDKIVTIPRSKIGSCIGRLDEADLAKLDGAMLVFLGLAAPRRARLAD